MFGWEYYLRDYFLYDEYNMVLFIYFNNINYYVLGSVWGSWMSFKDT